jgi:uncharacterized membrane protein YccC
MRLTLSQLCQNYLYPCVRIGKIDRLSMMVTHIVRLTRACSRQRFASRLNRRLVRRQRDRTRTTMGLRSFLIRHDAIGLHYAVRICIGTTAVWLLLRSLGDADADAIWAVISVIVATEPQMQTAVFAFMSRIVNTVIGCTIGLTFLLVAGPEVWVLPLALTVTVLVCTYLVRLSSSWRLAPATTALVIASGVVEQSRISGAEVALHRAGEVVLGCAVAFLITWCMSKIWAPPVAQEQGGH